MMPAYDAIVIGGGVLGVSTAYHLVRDGLNVLLVDGGHPGRATDAGAGIISPQTRPRDPDARAQLAPRAAAYYPELVALLKADDAGETGYARCGLLVVAATEDEREPFGAERAQIFEGRTRTGDPLDHDVREISPQTARRMFPPLAAVEGAFHYRQAARVDGRLLSRALRLAAERRGLSAMPGRADRLIVQERRVTGVVVDGAPIASPRVAIAGGAWSRMFSEQLAVPIRVEPQRGQIIHLRKPGVDTAGWPIVNAFRGHYMVPWPDGRVVVGATRETGSGFDPRLTAAGGREVLDEALRVAPGLAGWEVHDMRVGLRPLAQDGLPILGPVPRVDGVYLATGHGPIGLQLGPYSGKLIADLMLGRTADLDLTPFSVSRFLR